jgi:hypothetical protein
LKTCGAGSTVFPSNFKVVATGDVDGDRRGDFAMRALDSGVTIVCRSAGLQLGSCGALPVVPLRFQLLGAADYDGDQRSDLVWRDPNVGLGRIDMLSGTAVKGAPIHLPVGTAYRILAR